MYGCNFVKCEKNLWGKAHYFAKFIRRAGDINELCGAVKNFPKVRVKGARAVGFTEISRTLKTPDYCAGATTIKDLKNVQIAKHTKRTVGNRKAQSAKVSYDWFNYSGRAQSH